MSSGGNYPIYVTATVPWEIKPPKEKQRSTLFLQNTSANDVYIGEDFVPDVNSGILLGAGGILTYSVNQGPVPQGKIWVAGSQATLQRVLTRQA